MPLERVIERHLLDQCRARGILCLKLTSPSRAGVPDRLLVSPAGTVFVEVKRPGGRVRRLQEVMHEKLRRHGGIVHVVDTREGVEDLVAAIAGGRT